MFFSPQTRPPRLARMAGVVAGREHKAHRELNVVLNLNIRINLGKLV
jgi:hypothetical protein